MKVLNLTENSSVYTSNVFFVRGDWNTLEDVNTIVDVGRDPSVIKKLNGIRTGAGKKKVDQVILTHGHYDHTQMLPVFRELFHPVVYAASPYLEGVDHLLRDGETLKIGDKMFEVLYTPAHSSDSVCLFCEEDGVLFAGDTPIFIRSSDEMHDETFIEVLKKLYSKNIQKIYFGHGAPVTNAIKSLMYESLKNMRNAKLGVG